MTPYKLIKSQVAEEILKMQSSRPYIPALMSYVTKDFVTANVRHGYSRNKKSRYTLFRRLKKFSNLLIGNSSLSLRGIGLIGILASLAGFVFALYVVTRKLFGAAIEPGWPFPRCDQFNARRIHPHSALYCRRVSFSHHRG